MPVKRYCKIYPGTFFLLRGGEFSEFVGAKTLKEFQSIEELLKLESPLKIFKEDQKSPEPEPSTWQTLEKAEILRATRFEPLNWFDQCIVWTEEGKLWHFPINNEQGGYFYCTFPIFISKFCIIPYNIDTIKAL